MKLLFVSKNKFKHAEATRLLDTLGINVEASQLDIH
jgi:inosine/xanthosine triphosphate pyrophosphatase family protein